MVTKDIKIKALLVFSDEDHSDEKARLAEKCQLRPYYEYTFDVRVINEYNLCFIIFFGFNIAGVAAPTFVKVCDNSGNVLILL